MPASTFDIGNKISQPIPLLRWIKPNTAPISKCTMNFTDKLLTFFQWDKGAKMTRINKTIDIFTHCLNDRKHGILDANGKILPEVWEARHRGVLFDTAQGTFNLSFEVAEKCMEQNFLPDTPLFPVCLRACLEPTTWPTWKSAATHRVEY